MALIPGSVPYTGFIAPTDSTDTFPVTKPEWGLGGLRRVVDLTERDAITSERRELGMLVYVEADQTYYTLKTGLTNSDWEAATFTSFVHLTPHTYAELQTLVSTNSLVQGSHYLLTDYQTIYDQPDFQANGILKNTLVLKTEAVEPLILTAASDSTFSNTVISTLFPKDRIQYDFTVSQTYVSNSPRKGRITERIDANNNRTDYDHRTVKFIRYESSTGSGVYNVVNDNGEDSQEFLTFGTGCFNNYIGDVWELRNIAGREFPNFIMGGSCYSNKIGGVCLNNTWDFGNYNNTWGHSNRNNTWGFGNYNNTWGYDNRNNTYGNFNVFNMWGVGNQGNTWGNSNTDNTWGSANQGNTWGNAKRNNMLTNRISNLNFTSATHVEATYYCEIFIASNSQFYLKYFDGTQYQFVSPTS